MATIGRRNNKELQASFDHFEGQWPTWIWLRERLRKAGLEPTSARELETNDPRSSWVMLVRPSDTLVKHFELAPEILVLCSPWEVVQAKDMERAEEVFQKERRVDPGFALVLTGDPDAQARLGPVVPEKRRYLFVCDETFRTAIDPQAFVRDLLRAELGRRRLFDMRLPAAGPQFFGREKELEALERDVLNGQCIGVFGLRKVGKTSLLRRLAEKLREGGKVIPVEVDLQKTSYKQRNFPGVVKLIGRQLDRAMKNTRYQAKTRSSDPQQFLVDTVEHVQRAFGGRLLLMLDEYEVLLNGRIPPLDGVELLMWLRGVAQEHADGFSLMLAGRNSRLLAPARIEGADNPMYRFLRSVLLAGLTPEDCRAMVRKIGGRMALRFEHDALDIIVQETGGHPALARTLGNFVDEHVPISKRSPAVVDAAIINSVLPRFSRDNDVDEDMRELVNASNDFDPRAEDYLVHLAYGASWIGGRPEARIGDALVGYGILRPDTHQFRIGHLATWLRDNYACPAKAAHG
jgi:hypothetical protein